VIVFDLFAPNHMQTTILDFTLLYSYTHTLKHAQMHIKFNLHYFMLRQTDWKLKSQVHKGNSYQSKSTWCGYKITGLNFFLLPCKLGNSERCVVLACTLPSIHGYSFKVVRQTVWQWPSLEADCVLVLSQNHVKC